MFSTIRAYFPDLERRSPQHYIQAQMALASQQIADGQYQLAEEIFDQLDGRVTDSSVRRAVRQPIQEALVRLLHASPRCLPVDRVRSAAIRGRSTAVRRLRGLNASA